MTDAAEQSISRNTRVTLGLVVALAVIAIGGIGAFVGWAINDTRWKTNTERDILELRADLLLLKEDVKGGSREHWTRSQMRQWVLETRNNNPDWEPSPVDEVQ